MEIPEVTVIRSKRKTISLEIKRDLQVVVRCPNRMSRKAVEAFVQAHRDWLDKHLAEMTVRQEARNAFACADGETLYLLGESQLIGSGPGDSPRVEQAAGRLLFGGGIPDRMEAAQTFYRRFAAEWLPPRVERYAAAMGLFPTAVKITGAKTRWGSCSAKGSICFSWRLVCLPPDLADYVVVHELAHLREHNHSPRFYRVVEETMPDHAARRARMREWQRRLPL